VVPRPAPAAAAAAPAQPDPSTPRGRFPIKPVVGVLSAAGVIAIVWSFLAGGPTRHDGDAEAAASNRAPSETALASSTRDAATPPRSGPPAGDAPEREDERPAAGGPTRVGEALRRRVVRALDILLVASRPSPPLAYVDAERHCAALDIDGIRGWRLPEVGELGSLSLAGMVGRGTYWSHTAGDTFGDVRLAYNGKNGRIQPRTKESLALCVRGDRATQ
jgi:hypothetical protein